MRVAIVSTYQPRHCGIAVFSGDLRAALLEADSSLAVDIVSITRGGSPHSHPPEVLARIRQDVTSDYRAAAAELGRANVDVVLIEHEYGIFGGNDGQFVLELANQLTMPMVVTLHTVLANPPAGRARTLRALCQRAALIMVFTETARRMVAEQGLAELDRVRVVPHGAPDELTQAAWADGVDEDIASSSLQLPSLAGRTVLSTFGLISDSKGLELAIRALPSIIASHPEVLYLIAGQTHPEVIHKEGESYRLGLQRLVHDLDLCDHVWFIDRFLSIDELAMLLAPHRPLPHAIPFSGPDRLRGADLRGGRRVSGRVDSLLLRRRPASSGAGRLVPSGDSSKLAATVLDLLGSPAKMKAARAEARRVGADLTWASVGKTTLELLSEAAQGVPQLARSGMRSSPQIQPGHLLNLVDDVGIVQHAYGTIPNRSTGYCVDDVARLVIAVVQLEHGYSDRAYRHILASALAFLFHAWDGDPSGMHNFMDYGVTGKTRYTPVIISAEPPGRSAW